MMAACPGPQHRWPSTRTRSDASTCCSTDCRADRLAQAVDARIVDTIAEIDHDGLWGNTGCRSLRELIAWKTGCSPRNADTLAAIAHGAEVFPRLIAGLREGRLSADQVGVIAERGADGSDDHYAHLAQSASVAQPSRPWAWWRP